MGELTMSCYLQWVLLILGFTLMLNATPVKRSTVSSVSCLHLGSGQILEEGQWGTGTLTGCTCQNQDGIGVILCSKGRRRRSDNGSCEAPDGTNLKNGEQKKIESGSFCAQCSCNYGNMGCVSCAPPLELEKPTIGRIS